MRAPTTGTSSLAGKRCLTGDLTGDLLSDLTGDERVSVGGIAGVALYMNDVSSNLDIWLWSRLTSPCSTCNQSISIYQYTSSVLKTHSVESTDNDWGNNIH